MAADLPAVIARCRSVELAEVHATGGARQGFVSSIVAALHAAGIKMQLAHDLASAVPARVLS